MSSFINPSAVEACMPIIISLRSCLGSQEVEDRGTGFSASADPLGECDGQVSDGIVLCEVVEISLGSTPKNVEKVAAYFGIERPFDRLCFQQVQKGAAGYTALQKLILLHVGRLFTTWSTLVFSFNLNKLGPIEPAEIHDSGEFQTLISLQDKSLGFTSWAGYRDHSMFWPRVYRFLMQGVSKDGLLEWFECWALYDMPYLPAMQGYIVVNPARRYVSGDRPYVFGLFKDINLKGDYGFDTMWRIWLTPFSRDKRRQYPYRRKESSTIFNRKTHLPKNELGKAQDWGYKSDWMRNKRNFHAIQNRIRRRMLKRRGKLKRKNQKNQKNQKRKKRMGMRAWSQYQNSKTYQQNKTPEISRLWAYRNKNVRVLEKMARRERILSVRYGLGGKNSKRYRKVLGNRDKRRLDKRHEHLNEKLLNAVGSRGGDKGRVLRGMERWGGAWRALQFKKDAQRLDDKGDREDKKDFNRRVERKLRKEQNNPVYEVWRRMGGKRTLKKQLKTMYAKSRKEKYGDGYYHWFEMKFGTSILPKKQKINKKSKKDNPSSSGREV